MKTAEETEALLSRLTRGEEARLRAEDLVNAWACVRLHREQISAQIREHEAA